MKEPFSLMHLNYSIPSEAVSFRAYRKLRLKHNERPTQRTDAVPNHTNDSSAKLRVGIIGFGGAGIAHYSYFSCIPGCVVTKVFDPKIPGRSRASARDAKLVVCEELDVFWNDLDVVSVCSPDSTHADYISDALARGLAVYCEKPLTDSLDGLRKIALALRRSTRPILGAGHQMRFVPVHQKMKGLIEAGELGTLSYLEGYYVHDIRRRDYLYDDWAKEEKPAPLVRDGCHFIDLLRWLAGQEVEEVYAMSNNLSWPEAKEADLTAVMFRFAAGSIGKVLVAHAASVPQDHSVRVYGSDGSIENNVLFRGKEHAWAKTIHLPSIVQRKLLRDPCGTPSRNMYSQVRRNLPAWLLGKTFQLMRLLKRHPDDEYGARFFPVRLYEHRLACVEAIDNFVDAVRNNTQPMCNFEEAAKAVLICLAGVESYKANKPVQVRSLNEIVG